MESLSPECTPLKHRYDSCFNSWFEGYLQPALDGDSARGSHDSPPPQLQHIIPPKHSQQGELTAIAISGPSRPTPKRQIITNWSSAFPDRPSAVPAPATIHHDASPLPVDSGSIDPPMPFDIRGKSRNQIKAEEYERRCGSAWRSYQTCLKNAVKQNQSLATLLDQARVEHPLQKQDKGEGTVWDPEHVPETS